MTLVHPEPEKLKAFGLGRLPAPEAVLIERHVAGCDTCCQALATVADDGLVGLLRPSAETRWWPASLPSSPAPRLDAPTELTDHPRYLLVEVLGQGGMGTVFKAEHRLMNRLVAIKVVRGSLLENHAVQERFFREVRTAAQLDHPNIVTAHDAEKAGDICFLVMEYVPGESLAEVVRRRGPFAWRAACGYIRQAALGLQHAHERGLVHRDIKPGNLMLTPEGVVKVLDFGLARFTLEQAAEQTASGAILGTPAFMAPEQAVNARAADIRADIYSLGGTLYYLLAGAAPARPGTSIAAGSGRRIESSVTGIAADAPAELARVLERMLAPDPADRFQTPAEVAAALALVAGLADVRTRQFTPTRQRQHKLVLAAGLVVICGLVILLGYWFLLGDNELAGRREVTNVKRPDLPAKPNAGNNGKGNAPSVDLGRIAAKKPRELRRWLGHKNKVASIALVPRLRRFLTGSFGELYLWDMDKDQEVWRSGVLGWLHGVALSADGGKALAGGQDRSVHLWDVKAGNEMGKLDSDGSPVEALSLAPDGQHFVFTTQAGVGRLCTVKPLKEIGRFLGNPVTFAEDGGTFVSANERSLYIWDAQKPSSKELRRCQGPARRIARLALSGDGNRALTGEDWNPDGQAFLWDLAAGKATSLNGHRNVKAVALTPDGRLALTGDAAGMLRLWDASTGKMLHQWEGHDRDVSALALMPDGSQALSGGEDKTVRLWSLAD